ncbi:MAG: polyprenyl synthetase family protein [Proteobacteria bacterium]|nr:polyprenyl synthetase family protein [Pseudomonadota bacterium]
MMNIEAVYEMVDKDLQEVEKELDRNLQSEAALIPEIGKHILNSGGKRFRPLILILSACACGYQEKVHIKLASVLEFIHTATLLHDDVVDDANIRRGNSSANTLWGNQASILVGDFLFSQAFSLIAQIDNQHILEVLTGASTKLAQGEILDLVKENDVSCNEQDYLSIVSYKTASLIEAASQIGAILGRVNKEQEMALKSFGYNIGVAYQLMDDTLDYISTEEEFGKTIGKDLKEGKVTIPLIYTLRNSPPGDRKIIESTLGKKDLTEKDLHILLTLIKKYHGLDYSIEKTLYYAQVAKQALNGITASPYKEALMTVADYVTQRRT